MAKNPKGTRNWLTVIAVLVILAIPPTASAGDRNCTKEERDEADAWLFLNKRDQKLSLEKHLPFGIPETGSNASALRTLVNWDLIIQYDVELRVPRWVAYRLDAKGLGKEPDRVNCFRQDKRVDTPVASLPSDYEEPLFDQGHLAPSEDMSHTLKKNVNSFVMSNMAPQFGTFNRGIWGRLEDQVRRWVKARKTLYVITGGIFDRDEDGEPDAPDDAKRMKSKSGKMRVAIPTHFFKILVHECKSGELETIALVLPHDKKKHNGPAAKEYLAGQVTSIADIERLTATRFFPDVGTEINRSKTAQYWTKEAACGG